MSLRIALFLVGLSTSIQSSGQAPATVASSDILRSAWDNTRYQAFQQELAFFSDNERQLSIPVVEEVEFRTETHEFNPALQEYAVRLQFNSGRQIRVQRQVNQREYELRLLQQSGQLEELLYNRYEVLIDTWHQQSYATFLQARQRHLADQDRLIQARILEDGENSYQDWLQLQDERLNLSQKQELISRRLAASYQLYDAWLPANVDTVLLNDWLSIEQVESNFRQLQADTIVLPLRVAEQEIERQLVALELEAEEAEDRNWLNFLQVRYRGRDNGNPFSEELTIGAGIALPFRTANSVKKQYLQLEELEETNRGRERSEAWLQNLQAAESSLAAQLENYRRLHAEREEFNNRFGIEALQSQGISRAEVYLQAAEGLLKRDELLLDQERRIYEEYLDLLLLSNKLTARPWRNYFSTNQEILFPQ